MPETNPNLEQDKIHVNGQNSIADELRRESERLRLLAEELKKREDSEAEMHANYPAFKKFVYAELRKIFNSTPIPEGKDLQELAAEQGAVPFKAFIGEIEHPKRRP